MTTVEVSVRVLSTFTSSINGIAVDLFAYTFGRVSAGSGAFMGCAMIAFCFVAFAIGGAKAGLTFKIGSAIVFSALLEHLFALEFHSTNHVISAFISICLRLRAGTSFS